MHSRLQFFHMPRLSLLLLLCLAQSALPRTLFAATPVQIDTSTPEFFFHFDPNIPLATDVDVVALHDDYYGVPYSAFLDNGALPLSWMSRLNATLEAALAWKKPVYLALELLSGPLRTCPAQNASDGAGAAPHVTPFAGCTSCYDFSLPAAAPLQRAAALYATFVVEAMLDHNIPLVALNLAPEINLGAGRLCSPQWWPSTVEYFNGIYAVLKAVLARRGLAHTPVFASIQVETLWGVQAGQACAGEALSGAAPSPALLACLAQGLALVAPLAHDAFGVSIYPPLSSGAPAPQWYLPALLAALPPSDRSTFLIAETGWNRVPIMLNLANGTQGRRLEGWNQDPPLQCAMAVNSSLALANAWLGTLVALARQEAWQLCTWWSDTDLLHQASLPSCPCAVPLPQFQPSCTFITAFRELEQLGGGVAAQGEFAAKAFGAMGLRGLDGEPTALWATLQAARGAEAGAQRALPPLPWRITRQPDAAPGVAYFQPANGDKDGSLVAARLAGALGGVADTRVLALNVSQRLVDAEYAGDVAAYTASLYAALTPTPTLLAPASAPLVIGSVHRAVLYAAEALHAPVLPAQTLAFAATLQQVCDATAGGNVLALLGCDYGFDGGWVWLKPARAAGVPPAHVAAMAQAQGLLLMRALDEDEYDGAVPCSSGGTLYLHPSLRLFAADAAAHPGAAALWREVVGAGGPQPLPPAASAALRQWEWGLPDATVEAYSAVWALLHGATRGAPRVLQGGVVEGYLGVPELWRAYLAANGAAPAGITVEGYWTAQPALARRDRVLPYPAYAFFKPDWHPVLDAAGAGLAGVVRGAGGARAAAAHTRAFINGVGSSAERQGVALLLAQQLGDSAGLAQCSYGLDCAPEGTESCSVAGQGAPPPHMLAAWALANLTAPPAMAPLTLQEVAQAMVPFWGQQKGA